MADRMLFICWGEPVRGREERGLEVFNQALGLYGRLAQEGRIDGFDVCLLDPNGDLGGYVGIHGSADQLAAVRQDEEYQRVLVDATLVVEGVRVIEGYTNEGIARQMALYRERIAAVPQTA
jgi:hypothetical protein